ncbi:type VII secretion target [Mycolicibacterium sediminis]|uniref:ESX-1 secretion-associated protein n=1 Tax=Mycolicibacterium sediminis TaxID=1286180 RepID=A0A7I7QIH3_9MYCO|nr:ESX-1 secretion-associated protein [Mycolicibacterium sediminis]
MPGSRWTGSAASAYQAVNTDHGRVLRELARLDDQLKTHIDQSARLVVNGRTELDTVKKWVFDVAAAVPKTAVGERMLLPIVNKGLGDVAEIVTRTNGELNAIGAGVRGLGEQYRKLGEQKLAGGGEPGQAVGDDKKPETENDYEKALRDAGLLTGPPPDGYYREWLQNAERQGVPPDVLVDIARRHHITPDSFDVLNGMEKVTDADGKSFFLVPPGTSGADVRKAALMTYVLNAGTDYGDGTAHDFEPTPYSADEVQRIIDRQEANAWSYDQDVDFVHDNGGRLTTTPNGMLMGMGGNQLQDFFSEGGGSTWGDVFMVNIDDPKDPAQTLRDMIHSGNMWYPREGGEGREGLNQLDLDRILHHEERHSQQWQRLGYLGFINAYQGGKLVEIFTDHPLEKDAGLSDGGY